MKKIIAILLLLIVSFPTFTQNNSTINLNCYYLNDTINSTNYSQYIDTLGTQEIHFSLSHEEQLKLVDCLFLFEPANPQLNFHKAILTQELNKYDTSFFKYYRVCIENNYAKGIAYYNMSVFYINQFSYAAIIDSSEVNNLSKTEQGEQLTLAEKYLWLSYESGNKEPIFAIAEIHKLRNDFLNIPQPEINLGFDTLIILTQIKDCGEFGGHFESINLINNANHFKAQFYSDSIYCINKTTKPSSNSIHNGECTMIHKDVLVDFINAVESYDGSGILSNGPLEIAFLFDKQVIYKRIEHHDWPYYLEFRKKVFNF